MAESNVVKIPFKALCDAVVELNGVIEDKTLHIRTVGCKKEDIVAKFVERISDVIQAKADDQLPQNVCSFYQNFLVNQAEKARPFTNKKVIAMLKALKKAQEGAAAEPEPTAPHVAKGGNKKTALQSSAAVDPKAGPAPSTRLKKKTTAPVASEAPAKKILVRKNPANALKGNASTPPAKKGGLTMVQGGGKKSGLKIQPTVGAQKKDPKKGAGRSGRGTGMVNRAVQLYVVEGITGSKHIAAVIDKEFPNTNNRSTISHVRCILGAIPDGYLKPVKK